MTASDHTTRPEPHHRVTVQPLPNWLDSGRLLGPGEFLLSSLAEGSARADAVLARSEAAELMARLRGLGFGGEALHVTTVPPLPRSIVRAARSVDARRRWDTSVGFSNPRARADDEGRMSLTPEALAMQMAEAARGMSVVDACSGVGGNAIAFARAGCQVTAIDFDAGRLALAKHNAGVYGVLSHIEFVHGDATALLAQKAADLLFVDVPWGANWNRKVTALSDLPLLPQLLSHQPRYGKVWLKVPPSFATNELANFEPQAMFGVAAGDAQRVKFLWLRSRRVHR